MNARTQAARDRPAARDSTAGEPIEPAATIRPRLVLHVGVTGHRPPRLSADAERRAREAMRGVLSWCGQLLAQLSSGAPDLVGPEEPVVRVISSLAEGADQAAALAALELGCEVQCPLPFARDEYEEDFSGAGPRATYRRLLARASAVFELDGSRDDAGSAYLDAGRVVLEQSDLLMAVWDGERSRGRGGTAAVVAEALAAGIPVLQIPPDSPERPALLRAPPGADWQVELAARLRDRILPGPAEAGRLREFFEEEEPTSDPGWIFRAFGKVACLGACGPRALETSERPQRSTSDACGPVYDRANRLSISYAGRFRSAYVLRYLLVGLAVSCAVVGFYTKPAPIYFPPPEALRLLGVRRLTINPYQGLGFLLQVCLFAWAMLTIWLEKRGHWHLRALEYRILAEHLRVSRCLSSLGVGFGRTVRPEGRIGEPPPWVASCLRAVLRSGGLAAAAVDGDSLRGHRQDFLDSVVRPQIAYHRRNAQTQAALAKALTRWAMAFFALGFTATFLRAFVYLSIEDANAPLNDMRHWSTNAWLCYGIKVSSILFPAWAAMCTGIRGHGEFARLAARSRVMSALLDREASEAAAAPSAGWADSVRFTRETVEEMGAETADWRTLIGGKGLSLPV